MYDICTAQRRYHTYITTIQEKVLQYMYMYIHVQYIETLRGRGLSYIAN